MTIRFCLTSGMHDCALHITDAKGTREFYIYTPPAEPEKNDAYLDIVIHGDSIDLSVIPMSVNLQNILDEEEPTGWKDRIIYGLAKKVVDIMTKIPLRVGCQYHLKDLKDGDTVQICEQGYCVGSPDRLGALEVMLILYMFFEVVHAGERVEPIRAWALNREEFIRIGKEAVLAEVMDLILLYPIIMARLKHLSKDKYIYKTLLAFHRMSPEWRQKILDRMEK